MENSDKIIPPHLNAEIYRTDTTGTDTIPYLDYIRIHKDGTTLVGCSELTGRYWNGGASIYSNVTEAQEQHKNAKRDISLTSGTADGCFVEDSSKILLCEDNGTVSIYRHITGDAWKTWDREVSVAEHDDLVLAVDCLDPGQLYITVGADGNVKIWDIKDMICVNSFMAHNQAIYAVAVKPNSKKYYVTASQDAALIFWDENVDKPAIDFQKSNQCGIRCCAWTDENCLVYGDEAGVLRMIDVRNTKISETLSEFPAAVHKVEVQAGTDRIAVCCDNKIVSVCSISKKNEPSISYHDRHIHSNYVRGLAWDSTQNDLLHTVGWDGEIKTHKICD